VAVTQVGTHTTFNSSASTSQHSYSHTTTSDTSLLVLVVHIEGDETVTSLPTFNSSDFTLIDAGTGTGSNQDMRTYIYGMLSPGAATASVVVNLSSVNPSISACVNYAGTHVTGTIADATNVIDTVSNTGATSTAVFSSGGTSGNGLFCSVAAQGADTQPMASTSSVFSEIWDEETGGGSSANDFGHGGYELLSGIPAGTTITFGASDENSGVLIELIEKFGPTINVPLGSQAYTGLIPEFKNGGSWKEAQNTDLTAIDVTADVDLRLRTQIKLTGGADINPAFKYQYRKNLGSWLDITAASSNVQTNASSHFADGDDCLEKLLGGADEFVSDNDAAEETSGTFTMPVTFHIGNVIESELSFTLVSADLANGDDLDFRIVEGDATVFTTYTQTPSIAVTKGAAAGILRRPLASFSHNLMR
jgi:hypothetical protein